MLVVIRNGLGKLIGFNELRYRVHEIENGERWGYRRAVQIDAFRCASMIAGVRSA